MEYIVRETTTTTVLETSRMETMMELVEMGTGMSVYARYSVRGYLLMRIAMRMEEWPQSWMSAYAQYSARVSLLMRITMRMEEWPQS